MMNATIEDMRAAEAARDEEKRLTVEEITTVIDGLRLCTPLEDVAEASGLSTEEVLAVVAEFGTWLTHVHGGANIETIEPLQTGILFPINDSDEHVVIPWGFERTADHGRDVAKSLSAIVVGEPGEEEVARWLARKYPSDTAVLTFPLVAAIWKFAQLGRIDEVDQISKHSSFRRRVVEAYDILHVALSDSQDAARTIARLSRAEPAQVVDELETLRDATTKLSWLQPREMANLANLVDMCAGDERATGSLVSRLRTLGRLMASRPDEWYLRTVGHLNQGHVEQIARRAGLSVEGVSRAEEAAIRSRLADLGLKADADRLVPAGVNALLAGVEDTFWEAMELRASGDESWHEVLSDAYQAAD